MMIATGAYLLQHTDPEKSHGASVSRVEVMKVGGSAHHSLSLVLLGASMSLEIWNQPVCCVIFYT